MAGLIKGRNSQPGFGGVESKGRAPSVSERKEKGTRVFEEELNVCPKL
jgi:hypothetical protein